MAFDPKALIAEIRADLGLPEPEEPSLWQRATQPVKTLFGATQGVGGQLAGLLLPEEYAAAQEENRQNFQVAQGDPWYKQLEAAPGLGDVLAQTVPESISESFAGKIVGPVARMAGNIAGDPTTYTPAVLSKIGNVAKAGSGMAALEGLGAAPDMIAAARAGLSPLARAGVRAAELAPTTDKAMMLGASVYLPDIAQGVGASASEAWKQWAAGQYGDAVATGAGGALLGGLGFMIGKGNIDTIRASNILDNWFKENHPAAAVNRGPEFDLGGIEMPQPAALPAGPVAAQIPEAAAPTVAPAPPVPGALESRIGPLKQANPYGLDQLGALAGTPQAAAATAPTTAPPPPAPAAAAAPPPTPVVEAPPAPAAAAADEFEGVVPLGKSKVTTEEILAAARGTRDINGLVNALHEKFGKERNVSKQELKRYITAKINQNGALDKYWAKQPAVEAAPAAPVAEAPAPVAEAAPAEAAPAAPEAPAAPTEKKGFQTIEEEITEPAKFTELSGIVQKLEAKGIDLTNRKVREATFREMYPGEEGKRMRAHLNAFYAKKGKLQPRTAEPVAPAAEAAPVAPVDRTIQVRPNDKGVLQPETLWGYVERVNGLKPGTIKNSKQLTAYQKDADAWRAGHADAVNRAKGEAPPPAAAATSSPELPATVVDNTVTEPVAAAAEAAPPPPSTPPVPEAPPAGGGGGDGGGGPKKPDAFGDRRNELLATREELLKIKVTRPEDQARVAAAVAKIDEELAGTRSGSMYGKANADRDNVRGQLQRLQQLRLKRDALLDQPVGGFRDEGVKALDDEIAALETQINEFVATKPVEAGVNTEEGRLTKPLTPERVPEEPFKEAEAALKPSEEIWDKADDERGGYLAQNRGDMSPVEGEVMPAAPGAPKEPKVETTPVRYDAEGKEITGGGGLAVKPIVAEDAAEAPQQLVALFNTVAKKLTEKEWEEGDAALGGPLKGRKYRSVQGETPTSHRFKSRATQVDTASGLPKGVDFDELNSRLLNLRALLVTAGKGIGKEKQFAKLMKFVSEADTEAGRIKQLERWIFSQKRSNKGMRSRTDTTGTVIDPSKVTLESGHTREELLQMMKKTIEVDGKPVHDPNSVKLRLAVDDIIKGLEEDKIRPWNGLKAYEEELARRVDDPLLRDLVKVKDVRRQRFNAETGELTLKVENKNARSGLDEIVDAERQFNQLLGQARGMLPDSEISLPPVKKDRVSSKISVNRMKEAISDFASIMRENAHLGDRDAIIEQSRLDLIDLYNSSKKGKAFIEDGGVPRVIENWNKIQTVIDEAKKKPEKELPPAARAARAKAFEENEAKGVALGKSKVFDGDGETAPEFHQRVAAALGEGWAKAMAKVVKAMDPFFQTSAEFGGVNVSPYVAGTSKWKPGGVAQVYHNYLASLHMAHGDHREALKHTVYTLIHERMHPERGIVEDTPTFHSMVQEVETHIKASGQFDKWVAELEGTLGNHRAISALMPDFEAAVKNVRDRGKSAEGPTNTEVVPRRATQGSIDPLQNRGRFNPKGATASGGIWVRPAGTVPGGAGGATGQLGGSPPVRGRAAKGKAAEAGGVGGGGNGETQIAYLPYQQPIGTAEEAARELARYRGKINSGNHGDVLKGLWQLGEQIVKSRLAADPTYYDDMVGKPFPRSKDETFSLWNTAWMSDSISKETKAKLVELSNIIEISPEAKSLFTRYKPVTFDMLDNQVKEWLGVKSREELMQLVGKDKLSPAEAVLVNTLGNDLAARYQRAVDEWGKDPSNPAAIKALDDAQTALSMDLPILVNAKTNVARALAALRKKAIELNPVLSDKLNAQANIFEAIRKRYGNEKDAKEISGQLVDLWSKWRNSQNPADAQKFWDAMTAAMKYGKVDKFLAYYKGSLLGWPGRFANIGSNTGLRGLRTMEQGLAAALDTVWSKVTGQKQDIHLEEVKLNMMAMKDLFELGISPWAKTNVDLFRLKGADKNSLSIGALGEDLNLLANPLGDSKTARFFSFFPEALNADDALAKKAAQLDYYYRQTYRRLKEGGKPGFEMLPGENIWQATRRIARDIHDTGAASGTPNVNSKKLALYSELHEQGMKIAKQDTFQTDMPQWLQGVFGAADKNPISKMIAHTIVPFRRTPYNILIETLRRTPAGFLELGTKWKGLSKAERMDMMSRPMLGTAVGMGVLATALDGDITGGGPLDPEEEMNLRRTGWQPYSFKVGDQYISYQRLEPISSILGMAADAADGLKRGDFESFKSGMSRVSQSVVENLTNKTFLQSLEGLSSALRDPMQYMDRFVKQYTSSFVPNSLGFVPFGGLARAIDPMYRQTEAWTTSPLQAKIPGLSQQLPPQYNPTGDVRMREGTPIERLLNPLQRSSVKKDPIAMGSQLLDEIGSPPVAPKPYVYVKGIKVQLTPEERAKFAKAEEMVTKMIGLRLSRDPSFLRLPDNEKSAPLGAKTKVDVVQKLYRKYREQTMNQMMPTLMARAREQQKNG